MTANSYSDWLLNTVCQTTFLPSTVNHWLINNSFGWALPGQERKMGLWGNLVPKRSQPWNLLINWFLWYETWNTNWMFHINCEKKLLEIKISITCRSSLSSRVIWFLALCMEFDNPLIIEYCGLRLWLALAWILWNQLFTITFVGGRGLVILCL